MYLFLRLLSFTLSAVRNLHEIMKSNYGISHYSYLKMKKNNGKCLESYSNSGLMFYRSPWETYIATNQIELEGGQFKHHCFVGPTQRPNSVMRYLLTFVSTVSERERSRPHEKGCNT